MKNLFFILCLAVAAGSCNTSKHTESNVETEKYIPERLLVLLKPEVQPAALEKAFSDYNLKAMGQASRSQNLWMFSFDSKIIDGAELVKAMAVSPLVESVEQAPLGESPQ
jgi:hypothetical protein